MRMNEVPVSHCPNCQYTLDCASGLDHGAAPKPDDLSVCINCGTILVFDAELRVQPISNEVYESLDDDTKGELTRAHLAIKASKKTNAQSTWKAVEERLREMRNASTQPSWMKTCKK